MKCKICQANNANATGSHIVPHFLLKRIDNENGSTRRDKEMGFVLSEKSPTSYFGRATSISTLEDVYGEVTDELIEKNFVPLVEDNIFCVSCEKKLSLIESEYAKTINKFDIEIPNYTSSSKTFISFLFWTSVIWRLSIATHSGFQLKKSDEKTLHNILNKYLNNNIKLLIPKAQDNNLKSIGYILLRCVNYSDANSTFLFCHPKFRKPYYFIIDEFILIFHINGFYRINNGQTVFNLEKETLNLNINTAFFGEKIKNLKEDKMNLIKEKFYATIAGKYISNFSWELDQIHLKLGGTGKMNPKIKEEIISKLIQSEENSGVKYTIKHKAKIMYDVLKAYQKKD